MPLVDVDRASYEYEHGGGFPAVSLVAEAGENVHIGGASGSGKSTFARCLTGLIPHLFKGRFSGSVRIAGRDTRSMPVHEIVRDVGFVFQNPASQMLLSSVEDELAFGLENLGLPSEVIRDRIDSVARAFRLGPLRSRSPHHLSAGEQQRVALASIVAREPQVLVLDEPLALLDPQGVQDFLGVLDAAADPERSIILFERHRIAAGTGTTWKPFALGVEQSDQFSPPTSPSLPALGDFSLAVKALACRLGTSDVLHDIRITLRAGEVVGIAGPNGAGKTTLLRTLAGVQEFDGGISWCGVSDPGIRMVAQNPNSQIFRATVREEILLGAKPACPGVYEWILAALDLSPLTERRPLLLSEGQKKRVTIASALVSSPVHLLLLDEPCIGQDNRHKAVLASMMCQLRHAGTAVVVATHDLEFLHSVADRILLIDGGRVIADGPAAQIFADRDRLASHGLPISLGFPGSCPGKE